MLANIKTLSVREDRQVLLDFKLTLMAKKKKIARTTFTFRISWWQAMKDWPEERKHRILDRIIGYAETGDAPTDLDDEDMTTFSFIRSEIDAESEKPKRGKKTDSGPSTLAAAIDNEQSKSIISQSRDIFCSYYKGLTNEDYYWAAKDAGSMKLILNMLRYARKQKGLPDTDEGVLEALHVLLNSITDKWIIENMSVSIVLNKYNAIVYNARNGSAERNSSDKRRANEAVVKSIAGGLAE
jgi:hypothetical protein